MAALMSRAHVMVILSVTLVLLVGIRLYYDREDVIQLYKNQQNLLFTAANAKGDPNSRDVPDIGHTEDSFKLIGKLIEQRNNISKVLNLRQQKLGQLECEIITKGQDKHKVSSSGGWCAQTSKEDSGEHKTDTQLVPVLAQFLKGKRVGSFGDGPGRYKQMMLDTGLLEGYDAYDGAPFCEETSEGRVKYLDLTLPQYGLPLYDWIISLEVAEHIPIEYESIYIDNVVRHAKEGVILSWAKPGQEGYSHVNNRPFEYVKALFESLGFEHDADTSEKFKRSAKLEWLQWNTNVYRRKDSSKLDHIKTFLT